MTKCQGKNCTYIKKLLDSNSLNCQSCKKLLQLPVFLVDGVGNVCEKCRSENVNWKYIPNEIFNVLLQELIMPCTYAAVGCNEDIPYERMEKHLKLCKYRSVKCPHPDCTWIEWQDNFPNHFLESHKENVHESESFTFDLNLKEAYVAFAKLLIQGNLKFLFLLQQDKKADELSLSFFKFDNVSSHTTITFCNNGEEEFSVDTGINSLDLIDQNAMLCNVKKINLTLLNSMFQGDDKITLNVNILPNNHEILHILECPVCTETMREPIYQCEKGHSICNECAVKLKTCPTCKAAISRTIRNYSLENLTTNVFYFCSYKSAGCTVVLPGGQIMEHDANCLYHLYKCPLANCDFQYNKKNLLNHLDVDHAGNQYLYAIETHGLNHFQWVIDTFMYVSGSYFRVKYLYPDIVPPSCHIPCHYSMMYAFLDFEHLNPEEQFPNVYCKNTLTNTETQAEVTQIQFLNNAEKSGRHYYIFLPIEALRDSVDVSREGSCNFKCEILI